MINANEAHKMTEKNNTRKNEMHEIIEKVMPILDEHIRRVAGFGGARAVIPHTEIMAAVPFTSFTKKEILDELIEELKEFGFKAETTASYNSIHVTW